MSTRAISRQAAPVSSTLRMPKPIVTASTDRIRAGNVRRVAPHERDASALALTPQLLEPDTEHLAREVHADHPPGADRADVAFSGRNRQIGGAGTQIEDGLSVR